MIHERLPETNNEQARSGGAILAVHYKLHGGDGISLQSQLLHKALRESSREVFECSADLPVGVKGLKLPQLSYQNQEVKDLRRDIYHPEAPIPEHALLTRLESQAAIIRENIERYMDAHDVRVLDVHNIFSVPYNPAATVALYDLAKNRPDVFFIAHHHDFIFENRQDIFPTPPSPAVAKRIGDALLPDAPNIRHVVINQKAAEYLREKKHLQATVIPDGFDFDLPSYETGPGRTLRERAGIGENDLIIGVMTRIVPRKAIEFAVQFVHALTNRRSELENVPGGIGPARRHFGSDSRIVLLLPQHEDLSDNGHYFNRVKEYARSAGVTIVEAENLIESDINADPDRKDKILFYAVYPELDIVCYPTTQEGFGNQLLEAIALSRRTVPVVFEYPVFQSDIAQHIPHFISLGNSYGKHPDIPGLKLLPDPAVERAVEQSMRYLKHPEIGGRHARENLERARGQFDINTIAKQIITLSEAG